jgi:hypothetical protein
MSAVALARWLVYPLRTAPAFLIAVFSVLLVLATRAGLFGIPLGLILLSWFSKYSFVLMDRAAEGAAEPPVLSIEMVNPLDEQRPLMLLFLAIGLFYLSDAASYWVGPQFAIALAAVGAAILPAIVAVQGATGSVAQSLNPRTFLGLIWRLRWDYLLIVGFIVLVALFGYWVVDSRIGDALPLIVRVALLLYAWLAMFALIGGVLFERREDIDLEAVHTPERIEIGNEAHLERERERQVDRIYAEWRGGAHANAWQTILTQLAQSSDEIAELRWLYRRAAQWPDARLAERLARELLPRLLAQRATGEALEVVRERLRSNAKFRPARSADLLSLAHLARTAGDRPTVRLLLDDFSRLYPNDPAQAMVDQLRAQLQ